VSSFFRLSDRDAPRGQTRRDPLQRQIDLARADVERHAEAIARSPEASARSFFSRRSLSMA
jgi:hypothetical protein